METTTDRESPITPLDRANSQLQNMFSSIITTTSYAFFASDEQEPTGCTHKNLHGHLEHGLSFMLLLLLLKHTTYHLTVLNPQFGLYSCSESIDGCQWVPSFMHGGIQFHTFAPYALPADTVLSHLPLSYHLLHGTKI